MLEVLGVTAEVWRIPAKFSGWVCTHSVREEGRVACDLGGMITDSSIHDDIDA